MRWGHEGAQAVLTLPVWAQSDRFNRAWTPLSAESPPLSNLAKVMTMCAAQSSAVASVAPFESVNGIVGDGSRRRGSVYLHLNDYRSWASNPATRNRSTSSLPNATPRKSVERSNRDNDCVYSYGSAGLGPPHSLFLGTHVRSNATTAFVMMMRSICSISSGTAGFLAGS